jgi:F-type H+-transporting ATPase subunit gamma
MSESLVSLQRKIAGAADLESVVRTMKAVAASQISQYEKSVEALSDYNRTVEMGLALAIRQAETFVEAVKERPPTEGQPLNAIVFGSDQGLVGQFNDLLSDYAAKTLSSLPGEKIVWAMGERIQGRLEDVGLKTQGALAVPTSVSAIAPLVGQILEKCETPQSLENPYALYIFHNRPKSGAVYEQTFQRLLPLDEAWQRRIRKIPWPTKNLPEIIGNNHETLKAFINQYLFVSLYRACAESLASENASRLAAMQRASKNIDEQKEVLNRSYHQLRQGAIDEELFDIVSGFEALQTETK